MLMAVALLASIVIPDAPDLKSVADRMHGAVVQVRGHAGETASYATGVLVGSRLAVTTLHTVAARAGEDKVVPLPYIEVFLPDQGVALAQLVSADLRLDLALLRLAEDAPGLDGPTLAAQDPARGESLIAMGAGEDAVTAVEVTVSEPRGGLFAVSSRHPLDSRFWGGPLFDLQGRLAAIELTALGEPRAIPARLVKEWIERARP
jgi:S1-C subfamily serine protease